MAVRPYDDTRKLTASGDAAKDATARAGQTLVDPGTAIAPPRERRLGRYELIETIGAGGMGEVYRAYDPELDREVAIKRLTVKPSEQDAGVRLQREAQAIARLSHPHVVQVHDVGRDPLCGDLFVAMELVEGATLREWTASAERSWREIASIFAQAGEGLAAAHAEGLVHRDFKPENVLVTVGGTAKVVDFGLAKPSRPLSSTDTGTKTDDDRAPADSSDADTTAPGLQRSGRSPAHPIVDNLTPAGARLGTPAYMPPEQMGATGSDERADQFSFAVALYEAATGRLPFEGRTQAEYALSILEDGPRPFPRATPVPRRVQATVLRALRAEPTERFDNLQPLLTELRRDPSATRNRFVALGVAVGIGGTIAVGVGELTPTDDPATCERTAAAAAELWTGERRDSVDRALTGVDVPFASETAERTVAALDDTTSRWHDARKAVCLDARAGRGEDVIAARRVCLDRNLARQRDLIAALEDPSVTVVRNAVDAVSRVARELDRCAEAAYLAELLGPSEAVDEELNRAAETLDRAHTLLHLGEVEEGIKLLEQSIGKAPPERWPASLTLRWGTVRGGLERAKGSFDGARAILEQAALAGLGGSAPIAAADWQLLYGDVLYDLDDVEGMDRPYSRAEATLTERLGSDAIDTIVARATRGHQPFAKGEYERALEIYEEASHAAEVVAPEDDERRLMVDEYRADALSRVGRLNDAIVATEGIVRRLELGLGSRHPRTIGALEMLGQIRLRAGQGEEALADFNAALTATGSVRTVTRATMLANKGAALVELERLDEATVALVESLTTLRAAGLGDNSAKVLAVEANLAAIHTDRGEHEQALALLQRILDAMVADGIDDTSNGVMVRFSLAGALLHTHAPRDALAVLEQAIVAAQRAGNTPVLGRLHHRRARALDRLGMTAQADKAIEAARAAFIDAPDDGPYVQALAAYEAARARERGGLHR